MISNFTILSIPQWAVFAAVTIIIYGWTEGKRSFTQIGTAILFLLGIYAVWVIYTGLLVPESLFDTTEALDGEVLFNPDEIPMEGRMLPVYWGFVVNAAIALAAFITGLRDGKASKVLKIITIVFSLFLFFAMIGISRSV
jgi:heme A synthase